MKKTAFYALAAFLVPLAVFAPSLRNGFVSDDFPFITENPAVREFAPPASYFTDPGTLSASTRHKQMGYRPLSTMLLASIRAVAGPRPWAFHLASVLLHSLCAAAAFWLALWVFRGERRDELALWAALIYAVHPVQTEAVAWATVMCTLAGTLLIFLSLRLALAGGSRRSAAGSLALLVPALLFKESSAVLPILLALCALCDRFLFGTDAALLRRRLWIAGGALILVLVYIAVRTSALGRLSQVEPWTNPLGLFLMMLGALREYLRLLVWPHPLAVEYLPRIPQGLLDPRVILSFGTLLALAGALFYSLRRKAAVESLGLLWLLAALLPFSNLATTNQLMAERFLHVPLFGFAVVVSSLLERALVYLERSRGESRRAAAVSLLGTLLVAYAAKDVLRLRDWRDPDRFSAAVVRVVPQSARFQYYYGVVLNNQGRPKEASRHLLYALAVFPEQSARLKALGLWTPQLETWAARHQGHFLSRLEPSRVYFALGASLLAAREFEASTAALEESLRLEPGDREARTLLESSRQLHEKDAAQRRKDEERYILAANRLYARMEYAQAVADYSRVLRVNPKSFTAYNNRGSCYFAMRRYEEAVRDYTEALALDPDFANAYGNRGAAFAQLGRKMEALRDYDRALELKPDLTTAWFNRGMLRLEAGELPKARRDFKKACGLGKAEACTRLSIMPGG